MKRIKTKLPINQIVFDAKFYPRNDYFWQTAYDYSESMKLGTKFPPVVVAKRNNCFVLVDGKHRLEAYKILQRYLKKKIKKPLVIEVEVLIGLNDEQIYEEAVRRNIAHGQRFSIQERLQIATRLKDLHWEQNRICRLINITPTKLTNLMGRRLVNSVTNQPIILKNEVEHMSRVPQRQRNAVVDYQTSFTGQDTSRLIDELIVLIKTKAINLKDGKILGKLRILKQLLNKLRFR